MGSRVKNLGCLARQICDILPVQNNLCWNNLAAKMNFAFSERIAEIPHSHCCAKYPPLRKSEKGFGSFLYWLLRQKSYGLNRYSALSGFMLIRLFCVFAHHIGIIKNIVLIKHKMYFTLSLFKFYKTKGVVFTRKAKNAKSTYNVAFVF